MFGESESESPRTGSPWDDFIPRSDPVSPATDNSNSRSPRIVPKLVAEVEEGNVEYKLRLLNPSAERFTRLVTQLKWRLLEGGGQAYYELGVADSGQLVGLTSDHLAQSLQTLEEMAGEIGASVIIVKEIELPAALVETTKAQTPRGKIADGAMRMKKICVADFVEEGAGRSGELPKSAGSSVQDDDGCGDAAQETLDASNSLDEPETAKPRILLTPPQSASSSFRITEDAEYTTPNGGGSDGDVSDMDDGIFANELEIQTVYKPRPPRRRTPTPAHTPSRRTRAPKREAGDVGSLALELSSLHVSSSPVEVPVPKSVRKTEKWRRKELRRSLKTPIPRVVIGDGVDGPSSADGESEPPSASSLRVDTVGMSEHYKAFDELEAAASLLFFSGDATPVFVSPSTESSGLSSGTTSNGSSQARSNLDIPSSPAEGGLTTAEIWRKGKLVESDPAERRFIVEALVVRKMSLEDSYLDFGTFQL